MFSERARNSSCAVCRTFICLVFLPRRFCVTDTALSRTNKYLFETSMFWHEILWIAVNQEGLITCYLDERLSHGRSKDYQGSSQFCSVHRIPIPREQYFHLKWCKVDCVTRFVENRNHVQPFLPSSNCWEMWVFWLCFEKFTKTNLQPCSQFNKHWSKLVRTAPMGLCFLVYFL